MQQPLQMVAESSDEDDSTGSTADRRRTAERLETIQAQAKRLCTSISDEMSHLNKETEKVIKESQRADEKAAAANALAEAAHAQEAAKVQAAAAALQAEKDSMANTQQYGAQITLNIGGTKFMTSRSTLCKHEGSFLEAMVRGHGILGCAAAAACSFSVSAAAAAPPLSLPPLAPRLLAAAYSASACASASASAAAQFSGRHAHQPSDDGSFFIDRDPTHFQKVLNYLRTGAAVTPEAASARAEMAEEAAFYSLPALHRALTAPPLDLNLGEEITRTREVEMALRARYCLRDESGAAKDKPQPHEGLLSLFEGGGDSIAHGLKHSADPAKFQLLLDDLAFAKRGMPKPGDAAATDPANATAVVPSLSAFRTNYNKLHPNILNRLEPLLSAGKVFIAGGSVLQALSSGHRLGDYYGPSTDVDIFLHSCDAEEATALTKQIFDAVAVDAEKWSISRGRGVISMIQHVQLTRVWERDAASQRHQGFSETVQVILRQYDSPAEVLLGFDIDCACCGYDGTSVWLLPRCVRALRHGVNVLNPLHAWPVRGACE